ncbi:MAG TPA: hypothetical protein VMU84_03410 [Thermoanaerobaculia bacterium]|nr:hypothetical protein [Thermoanaerobaculia bacterium]
MRRRTVRIIAFIAGALLLLIGAPAAERALLVPDPGLKLGGQLSKVQEEAIGSAKDVSTLLINWAFILIGFNAWFMRRSIESARPLPAVQKLACATGVVTAAASIFFGQTALSGVALLLQYDIFSVTNRAIRLPSSCQFIALLLSVASAAVLIIEEVFWPEAPQSRIVV